MIRAVFFDAGGVLMTMSDFEDEVGAKMLNIDEKVFGRIADKYSDPCEGAKISDVEFLEKFSKELGISSNLLRKRWLKIYFKSVKKNLGVYSIAFALKRKGYRIGVISNTKKMYTLINNKKRVYSGFSPVVLSYEVGIMKPNKRIYALACRLAKVKPSEAVFIDDRIKNIRGARAFGMKAILYRNPNQLKRELKKLRLKF